ncbi:MAG: phenylacetate-CoA oxygenase subunit PaaI [Rhizobiaceae bacterium]|nr:phenylacetate-CoA oxygenase subunit PaaI [Rhizobiaceae bacterium]
MSNSLPDLSTAINELLCVADSKWVLGHWYIKVIPNGRCLPDFNALSGMAQDELGHTRAMFSFLEEEELVPVNRLEFDRPSTEIHNMQLLDEAPKNWADFVVTAYLAETALWRLFSTFENSAHPAIANMVDQFGQESRFHHLYCKGWVQAFDEKDFAEAAESIKQRLPLALDWFGSDSSDDSLVASGVRTSSSADARTDFINADVAELLELLNLPADTKVAAVNGARDAARRRPAGSAMPAELWEFVLPTNEDAMIARRPLLVSSTDNVLWSADNVPEPVL